MCIKCDLKVAELLTRLMEADRKSSEWRRSAMLNNTLDNVGEQAQPLTDNSVPRMVHEQAVEQLRAENQMLTDNLRNANARANEAEMLALANRRWSDALNEQIRELKQQREEMDTEHENLVSAYKALLESQRLLILSLE